MVKADTDHGPITDACVHCALERVLRAAAPVCAARGLTVVVRPFAPVRLPTTGARVYRSLRRLLSDASRSAAPGAITLSVYDRLGAAVIEVTATVRDDRRGRVLRVTFPRHAAGSLEGGFFEGVAEAGAQPA